MDVIRIKNIDWQEKLEQSVGKTCHTSRNLREFAIGREATIIGRNTKNGVSWLIIEITDKSFSIVHLVDGEPNTITNPNFYFHETEIEYVPQNAREWLQSDN